MRLRWLPISCFAAALACAVTPARAQSLTAAEILQQFNAVIFGNFTTTSDVEGRTVIGGNMTGGATFALNANAEAASAFTALSVYGSETSNGNFNVDGLGGITIAGSNAGSFSLNAGGSVFIGGSNSGQVSESNASGSVAILGANSGTLTLNDGGSVFVGGSNTAGVTINGGSTASDRVSIGAGNTGTVTLNNGGTVTVNGYAGSGNLNGGSLTYTNGRGNWNLNGGAKANQVTSVSMTTPSNPLPSFASTFEQPMQALSTQLAALTPTSTVLTSGNNVTLEAEPGKSGIAVLDISTSVFQQNDNVTIALNGAKSFIINLTVAGCSSNCSYTFPSSVHFQNPTSYADSVLWNVTDVSTLSFTNEFGGTVLAPQAAVTNNGPIDGDLVAWKYTGYGELHDYPFTGPLPTPEPSGLAVMAVGLAGLVGTGALSRRRRARAAL